MTGENRDIVDEQAVGSIFQMNEETGRITALLEKGGDGFMFICFTYRIGENGVHRGILSQMRKDGKRTAAAKEGQNNDRIRGDTHKAVLEVL